jgi:CheY-like chemotaxis protein
VIANLLNNAAKFTPRGGRIWLTLQTVGNMIEARVRDNGIGVRAEALPRLFDMFYQPAQGQQPQSGLGIGLTLSRRLVELHGGTLEGTSAGEGHGSEFVVRIPVGVAGSTELSGPVPDREAEALPRRRILIVDDNRDSVESLRMVLSMMGSDIRVGYDGVDAVTLAHEFRPEIALIDIGMPRMNGYEAARRIRRQPWGESIKLVAMTGWGQDEDRRRARDAGFDHHLTKPVDPAALRVLLSAPENASDV